MPKKSKPKPKPRTNWKQRALHCEEVIGIQNEVEKFHAANAEKYRVRAEAAENRVGILNHELETIRADAALIKLFTPKPPTHWQRFKSWLSAWKVELLVMMLALSGLAVCVAFAYWPR